MLKHLWRTAGAAIVVLAIVPAAHASAAPHLVVWSGGLVPTSAAKGVELKADGTGARLTGTSSGPVKTAGAFAPTGAKLAAIRSAADKVLSSGQAVTSDATRQDGGYVSVLVEDGSARRAVVNSGADSPQVLALLKALNAALPASARLPAASPTGVALRRASRASPPTAPCAPGQQATDVVKKVPMPTGAAAGIVQLTPKGLFGGDSVAVDGTWKPIAAPTTITVHLEIGHDAGDGTDWAPLVQSKLAAQYAGYKVDGQPVNFQFDVVNKDPSGTPRGCYHEIQMHLDDSVRSYVDGLGPGPEGGEWEPKAATWAHEVGHLIGVDDHYTDYFHINKTGANVKLPENGLEGDALQAALPAGIKTTDGRLFSKPWKGYGNDLMATGKGRLRQADLNSVVGGADLLLTDAPGDVLVNKNTADQNLVTAADFGLRIPKNGTAHVDGLVAYCIDLHKHVPGRSGSAGFDVLGPAGALGTPAMDALQRIADAVAARAPGPLQSTPGANDAFWRVSDDADTSDDPDALAILAAAGVPGDLPSQTFAAPHYEDAGAASAQTGALTLTGDPVPPPPAPVEGVLPPPAGAPALGPLALTSTRVRAGATKRTKVVISAQLTVAGLPDTVSLALTRGSGRHAKTVGRLAAQPLPVGQALVSLVARGLTPGRYTLVAQDAGGRKATARLTVTRARRGG